MKTDRFDLAGVLLDVSHEDPELVDPFAGLIGEWQVADAAGEEAHYSIVLKRGPVPDTPGRGRFIYRGMVEGAGPFEFTGDASDLGMHAAGEVSARFSPQHGTARVLVSPKCEPEKLGIVCCLAIDQAVTQNGRCMVHAACLETPDGDGCIILHAPSGTGKTTTALALVALGYRLCSDDMTILAPVPGGSVVASGVPRAVKVHKKTAEFVDWLAGVADPDEWDDDDEQWIRRRDLSGGAFPGSARPLRSVIALRRTGGPGGVWPMNGADALMEMMADNISLGPDGLFPGHEQRLSLYSAALASASRHLVRIDGPPQAVAQAIHRAVSAG